MQYFPNNTFIETIKNPEGHNELIVTIPDKNNKIPMLRYNTEDNVSLLSYKNLYDLLSKNGYKNLIPSFRLPFGIVLGRNDKAKSSEITPSRIKEALYLDFNIADKITGNFEIITNKKNSIINIQLKCGLVPNKNINKALENNISSIVKENFSLKLIPFNEDKFGLCNYYLTKNKYLK